MLINTCKWVIYEKVCDAYIIASAAIINLYCTVYQKSTIISIKYPELNGSKAFIDS